MCGDTNCPSCGPAQGYDPQLEEAIETFTEETFEFIETPDELSVYRAVGMAAVVAFRKEQKHQRDRDRVLTDKLDDPL
jgi:hypothetical protein